jgi:hypothetical protein
MEKAIRVYRQAVERMDPDSPERPSYLNNLGNGLSDRYARTGSLDDMEEAIRVRRQAVERTDPDSPDLPARLNNLGNGLRDRYARSGSLDDLEEAISIARQAMERTDPDSPERPSYLNNLGTGLSARYARSGSLDDLEQAIRVYRQAVERTDPDSPDLPALLNNLGTGLRDRYARTGSLDDLEQAIRAYAGACQDGLEAALEESLRSARNWGNWALERRAWAEAVRAYGYGMEAIERLYRAQLTRRAKEAWLREAQGLPARAAYALARTGDVKEAAVALERGRARLLAEVLERDRADLDALEQAHPAHCQGYRRAAARVAALSGQELRAAAQPPGFDLAAEMRAARAELDAAIKRIRALPGYADFLARPDWEDISGVLEAGSPLVYIAATPAGGMALVAHIADERAPGQVVPLWLDDLTEDSLRERIRGPAGAPELGGYLGAYARWLQNPRDPAARAAWFAALDETTRWLWDALMGPLVQTLEARGYRRAVLIPTGWLAFLPLHAARSPYTYALDRITFTYAPSARALVHARKATAVVPGDRLFAVDNPDGSLRHSTQEVDSVARHFSQPWLARRDHATRNTALHALPRCDVYHFSCHGNNNWNAPLESALWMYGQGEPISLTVRDLLGATGAQARLAFLSACETGLVGTDLPDEVVGLAAGFLQAGAASVVSTLWAVNDASTALLAARFYEHWKGDGMEPPEALVAAQRWLRDEAGGGKWSHPYYWAGFTLTGV